VSFERAVNRRVYYSYYDDDGDVEMQSGMAALAVTSASAAVVAGSIAVTSRNVGRALHNTELRLAQVVGSVEGILASLNEFVQSIRESFGAYWLLPVALGLFSLAVALSAVPLVVRTIIDLARTLLAGSWRWLSGFFLQGRVRSESGVSDDVTFFATLAATLLVPHRDPAIMVGEIMRRVGSFERTQSGMSTIFERGMKYVELAVNAILSIFTDTRCDFGDSTERLLKAWAKKVDAFESLCVAGNPTLKELRAAVILMQEGIGFRQVLKSLPSLTFVNRYTDRLAACIQAHKGALNAASSFRMAPLTFMLGGGSGVGKTSVIKWLASAVMLLGRIAPPEEVLNNMWQKGISEYWNGYVQQAVYIMDDCFQQKTDGKQLDNEAMFLIRAVGNWAFPLNFADLDSKGRFYFLSDLIMGTTNVNDIKSHVAPMVAAPTAVTRRIEHGYWAFVSDDFKVPGADRLDYAKVARTIKDRRAALGDTFTAEELLQCIPWEAWVIVPHAFDGPIPSRIENNKTLLDVARELVAQYEQRSKAHEEEVEDLMSWAKDLASAIVPQSGMRQSITELVFGPESAPSVSGDRDFREPQLPPDMSTEFAKAWAEVEPDTEESPLRGELHQRGEIHDELVRSTKARYDWIGDAIQTMLDWLEQKNMPRALTWVLKFIDGRAVSAVEEEEAFLVARKEEFAKSPHRAFLSANFGRAMNAVLVVRVLSLAVSLAVSLFKTLFEGLRGMFGGFKSQSNVQGSAAPTTKLRMPRVVSQLGNPPTDHHSDAVYRNTYKILFESEGGFKSIGQILFVEGDLAVMPSHFLRDIRSMEWQAKLRFVCLASDTFSVDLSVEAILGLQHFIVPDTDVVFLRFERRMMKAHRSIVSMFLTETAMQLCLRNKTNHVRLDVARHTPEGKVNRMTFVSNLCEYQSTPIVTADGDKYSYTVSYNAPTAAGDCGAPLTLCEPRHWGGACIIGFHIAGKAGLFTRKGYSSILTKEIVMAARSDLSTWSDGFALDLAERGVVLSDVSYAERVELEAAGLVGGSHILVGKVDKPICLGGDTKIRKSPLHETRPFGPAPNAPAHLKPVYKDGEKKYPMVEAMRAYQTPVEIDRWKGKVDMGAVVELAMAPHWEATLGYDRSILTFEEAVDPPPGMKLKPLNRSTSPGYPYRLGGGSGKKDFFGADGPFTFDSERAKALRADVSRMVESYREGVRPAVVFTDFPKDELRPHAKVDAVATRAISGAPLDYTVVFRMYFGAFMAASFSTCVDNGMAPGINPYTDWHLLADKLLAKGKTFAGDFSRFDASEQPDILVHILDYINRWYRKNSPYTPVERDEHESIRQMLFLEVYHSMHLTGLHGKLEYLVRWNKSLPSGHPLTTFINSMYALVCLTACYVYRTGDYKDMWEHVFLQTFGDDNINSVAPHLTDVFNQVTVADAMWDLFCLKYTSDKKGEELKPFEPLEELTFLKRRFVFDREASGGWAAPLEPDSFMYTPYWFKNPRDPAGDLGKNVELMLGELSLHSATMWDDAHPKLEAACEAEGIRVPFQTRAAARAWMLTRSDVWH
jgi:hypothetical protein